VLARTRDAGAPLVVTGQRNRWTVTGPPGAEVEFAQRYLAGWRCTPSPPTDDVSWLTVRLGPDGRAECVYRTQGLVLGGIAQLLAIGGMALLWRRSRGA
jgi:hypothetical protein